MRQTLQKIESYMRKHHMIRAGGHIIAGVSGGADSVCLLLALLHLRQVFGYTVSVVHVEHGMRGIASRLDAEFVRCLCEEQKTACRICHCDVPAYAKAHGMGEEEAGRKLRYAFFEEEKKKFSGREVRIAVAHHLGDNAETMLFHLARGTGIHGLAGIAPVRGDIIRPLLFLDRGEIEAYLAAQQQGFCTDATNGDLAYSRNRIRHAVMPALECVNSRAARHMYETAQQMREMDAYLKEQAAQKLAECCAFEMHGAVIDKEKFDKMAPVLQKELLHLLLKALAQSAENISREHIRQLLDLFSLQNGRRLQLPYGLMAERVYGGVKVFSKKDVENVAKNTPDCEKERFSFQLIENFSNPMPQISKKKYTKCFDYDKIKSGFCIRCRQPGDYLIVNAAGERQKLKKYLVNEKIPAAERGQLLLLADGAHIMWVVGYRMSSYYKVSEHTRKILEVTFNGGKEDE